MYLFAFLVPIIAIFLESYPRLLNRKFGVDIWTHLLYLKEYHKQKGIPKKIKGGFLVPGTYDYPPAFIYILSKFPVRLVEKYEFLFSPLFDAIHLILIFVIVNFLTGNIYIALTTQLIYLLTPIIVIENSSATPRSLGYLLFTIVFMCMFGYVYSDNFIFLAVSIFFGSLIFISHRFTTQGYLFFSIILSVVYLAPVFLISFILSFLTALLISRGFYLRVYEGHLGNLKFWRKVINYRFYHQVKGEHKKSKSNDFVFNVYNQFLKFPPFVLMITNPWVVTAFFSFVLFELSPITKFLLIWLTISYILSLLTIWVPKLRFLGEGQRYLELSAFPASFLSTLVLFDSINRNNHITIFIYSVIGILCLVTIVVIQRKAIVLDSLRTITPSLSQMFTYLKKIKKKPSLLCIPHQITTNTIYHTDCPVFVNADYKGIEKIIDVYPYLKLPVKEVMKKYSLDYILLNEDYAKISDLKLKKFSIIKRFENIVLIDPEI